jgi:hypothetical protein
MILFSLIGFYCATTFATVIGQIGDWDILSAGLDVAIVESIGDWDILSVLSLGKQLPLVARLPPWPSPWIVLSIETSAS